MKQNILILLLISLMTCSCGEDFLEIAPEDSANVDNFYKTERDYEAAIVGVYHGWRIHTVRPPMHTEFRADNFLAFTDAYVQGRSFLNAFLPDDTSEWWNAYRDVVAPANLILDQIDGSGLDQDFIDRVKGEALFMRGYAYYWMNLVFGGVPLVTAEISTAEALAKGRASESETWDLVANDFEEAVSLLPLTPSELGRIDKHAAAAYLAKTYLMQKRWNDAIPVLKDIYDNSGHILEENFTDMFNEAAESSSKEYMLTTIYTSLVPNNLYAAGYLHVDGDPSTQGQFFYRPDVLDGDGLDSKPEFWESGDIRKDATVGVSPVEMRPLNKKFTYGQVGNDWTPDMIVVRFADVVLMYAEALTMAAGSVQQQSLDLMNRTRNRAGLDDLTLADVPNMESFVEAILQERRSELYFEPVRYADLKRHDKLLEKVNAFGSTFDDTYLLYPIPQNERQRAPGTLEQNPGYNF